MKQVIIYTWLEYSEIGIIFGISSKVNTKLFIQIFNGGQYISGINFSKCGDDICFIQISNVSG